MFAEGAHDRIVESTFEKPPTIGPLCRVLVVVHEHFQRNIKLWIVFYKSGRIAAAAVAL